MRCISAVLIEYVRWGQAFNGVHLLSRLCITFYSKISFVSELKMYSIRQCTARQWSKRLQNRYFLLCMHSWNSDLSNRFRIPFNFQSCDFQYPFDKFTRHIYI